jgi:hypothetical protein
VWFLFGLVWLKVELRAIMLSRQDLYHLNHTPGFFVCGLGVEFELRTLRLQSRQSTA